MREHIVAFAASFHATLSIMHSKTHNQFAAAPHQANLSALSASSVVENSLCIPGSRIQSASRPNPAVSIQYRNSLAILPIITALLSSIDVSCLYPIWPTGILLLHFSINFSRRHIAPHQANFSALSASSVVKNGLCIPSSRQPRLQSASRPNPAVSIQVRNSLAILRRITALLSSIDVSCLYPICPIGILSLHISINFSRRHIAPHQANFSALSVSSGVKNGYRNSLSNLRTITALLSSIDVSCLYPICPIGILLPFFHQLFATPYRPASSKPLRALCVLWC